MKDPGIPAAVWNAWNLRPATLRIRKISGGFSGAEIYHCRHEDGSETALRRWPADTPATRIREVQMVLKESHRQGCDLVPKIFGTPEALLTVHGRHWEHIQWMPGQPCQVATDAWGELEGFVTNAAGAVGRFHTAAAALGTATACPAAVIERSQRIAALERFFQQPSLAAAASGLPDWVVHADSVLRMAWSQHGGRLTTALAAVRAQSHAVQYVLRDCHHAHILFDADSKNVSGLIDFDALRVDTPATDLARLVHSFAALSGPETAPFAQSDAPGGDALVDDSGSLLRDGWQTPLSAWRTWIQEDLWAAAVAGIRRHCSFSQQQYELARLLADATTLLSLANWVTWSLERRSGQVAAVPGQTDVPGQPELIQSRVELLSRFAINYFIE